MYKFFERLVFQLTSGRFIFTLVVALVYAYLAVQGGLKEDKIMEVTLIVLYAYFNKTRPNDILPTTTTPPPTTPDPNKK